MKQSTKQSDKNTMALTGVVAEISKSHETRNETFYRFMVEIVRLSGTKDTIPVIVSEKLLHNNTIVVGDIVTTVGQVRTRNESIDDNKYKLHIYAHATDIIKIDQEQYDALEIRNEVEIEGYVCKQPTYRETKTGRIIADVMIASNRIYFVKTDYIPCVVWGINAKMARNLEIGEKIKISGRFQSRNYHRKSDDTDHVAYEISVSNIEAIDEQIIEENKIA